MGPHWLWRIYFVNSVTFCYLKILYKGREETKCLHQTFGFCHITSLHCCAKQGWLKALQKVRDTNSLQLWKLWWTKSPRRQICGIEFVMLTLLWRSASHAQENQKEIQSTSHHTQQGERCICNFTQLRPLSIDNLSHFTNPWVSLTTRLQPKGDQATYGCIEIIGEVGQGKRERTRPSPQPGSWACLRKLAWNLEKYAP